MADLFECPLCKEPFVADDRDLVERRHGYCFNCMKIHYLKSFGLPPDFLDRYPGT
jgi:hypothetical protein